MAAAQTCAAAPADGVDLVNKDDGGRALLGLLEQVAHTAGADADIQLDKVRAGDRQKLHARLACDGLGDQRFAGARRADQQYALGNFRANAAILLRVAEKIDDLLQLLLFLLRAGDVRKGDLLLAGTDADIGLAKFERTAISPSGANHQEVHGDNQNHHQQDIGQKLDIPGCTLERNIVIFF